MLELRPNCECCDKDLPPEAAGAFICSFECTFCETCATAILNGRCPNCTGHLLPRPMRPVHFLTRSPASSKRIRNPGACAGNLRPAN